MIDSNARNHRRPAVAGSPVPLPAALAEWRALLGEGAVLAGAAAQSRYGAKARQSIGGALRPSDSAQVAPILRIATRHGVPLHPVSTGRNWGYGDARPGGPGVVVLDLSRLDRILHIDAALGTVTLEPGVTQGQLRRELDRRFPDEPRKGTTYYAVTRSLQMKFLRLPKAQVKIGEKLPETYR